MAQAFTITTTTNHVELDAKRAASVTYTVSNKTGQALTGRASLETVPKESAHKAWLALQGASERPFAIGAVQQYIVDVNAPADALPGEHTFLLSMVATHNPDETYTPGPTIALVVPQPQPKPRFPRWLIPLIVGVFVVLLVIILYLVLRPEGIEVPAVAGLPEADARGTVEAVGLTFEPTGETPSDEVPVGVVIATTPEARVRLDEATPVFYVLSAGPAQRLVPDVVGLTVDDALSTLEAEGFAHRPGGDEFSDVVAAGLVARTEPGAGTPEAPGARVVWFQSAGPELPDATDLEGIDWRLESYLSEAGDMVNALPDNRPTARFETGQVVGNASCNSYSGSYEVNGNRLEMGGLSSTLILCFPPEIAEQERRYLALLRTAASFLAPDGKLEILDAGGQTILVYNRSSSFQNPFEDLDILPTLVLPSVIVTPSD